MFIEVGYGLEAVLPDALCKQITEFEIKPRFKTGDYAGGLTAGVNAILAATRHEYKGTGTTVFASRAKGAQNVSPLVVLAIFMAMMALMATLRRSTRRNGWIYSSGGWGGYWGGGGGGSSGGGGFSGGFMGGGGSSGGGGAGSSW
jgi:uncharacterized protein